MQPSEIHLNANNPFVNPNTLLNLHPHQGNADPAAPVNNMNGAAPNLPNQENAAPIPSVPPAVEPPGQVQSINKDLIIIFLKGRGRDTIQDRTKGAKLRCLSTPDAIQGALLVILQKERVCIPLYHFRFAYHTGPKTAGIGIYDYQMDNDITLPEIHHFSLSETPQDPANPNSSNPTTTPSAQQTNTNVRNNNKLYYAQRNLKMDEGDCMLRKVLSSEEYGMLKNDRQLWTKWRYKLSLTPDSLEDPEIFLELQADIYNKKNNHNKNNSRHVSHGITGVNPIQNQDTQAITSAIETTIIWSVWTCTVSTTIWSVWTCTVSSTCTVSCSTYHASHTYHAGASHSNCSTYHATHRCTTYHVTHSCSTYHTTCYAFCTDTSDYCKSRIPFI
eukprot:556971_1